MQQNKKKYNNSAHSQCLRLLARLKQGPVNTVEARHELDILGVAQRIWDIRHKMGYEVKTFWQTGSNPGGSSHRIALYVLSQSTFERKENAN
jgi:hypothetical protein